MLDFHCAGSPNAAPALDEWQVYGVDFSSAPSARKPITVACARLERATGDGWTLVLGDLLAIPDFGTFDDFLQTSGPWIGGFDFPFGLPRALVETLGWPRHWPDLIEHFSALPRASIREVFKAFCAARPAGRKFAHRATDGPAGSSPSMKWVNPPVAWMLHAGAPRLLHAGVHLPGIRDGDRRRIALEAYPGLIARSITRDSYKSDDRSRQNSARAQARRSILEALSAGRYRLGLPVTLSSRAAGMLDDDPRADWLDALLCAVQAGWALTRSPGFGLPAEIDPIEGWIVGA